LSQKKSASKKPKTVLFMAGGTGGHVFPALACATALQAQGIKVHWLGTAYGLEARVIPAAGIDMNYLSISGLRSKNALSLLAAPFKLMMALSQAAWLLSKLEPDLVVGMGGFASGPGGLMARIFGIPLVIHEQNAVSGLTNRILARLATHVLEAFPQTFPAKYKAISTGNPLRYDILSLPKTWPKPLHKPLHILVVGGSLGALVLNMTVPQATQRMRSPVVLWHQTGRQGNVIKRPATGDAATQDIVQPFIEKMADAYDWADLIVCRAGALTISEVAQAGLPSVLIPYPHAVDDHQTKNAQYLVKAGAAVLVQQTNLTVDDLAILLDELASDPARLQAMAGAARGCARPDAVTRILEVCAKELDLL
jgi:UDP-N-acetylglucosamine--N-acetylmuramyl-(pentapeptide) pyrophosphoryl-undecaprenol N-acetylglucosamine transferase